MADLIIRQIEHNKECSRFRVEVIEGTSRTIHEVTLSEKDYQKLTKEKCTPRQCIQAAFEFLLAREDKEAILSEFDISVISKFFPEFKKELPKLLPKKSK
jgi:hypothetical protein